MPDRTLPRPHWPLYLALAGLWLLVGLAVTASPGVGLFARRAFIDIGYIVLPLCGVVVAARRARVTDGERRRGWWIFAAAFGSWALGGAYWTYYELILHRTPPFPSPSDIGFVGFAVLAAAALAQLARQWGPPLRSTDILDILFIAAATAYPVYDFALSLALQNLGGGVLATVAIIAYPAAETAVLTLAIFTVSRAIGRRRQPLLIAGGLGLFAITDATWIYLTGTGAYVSGRPFDLLWHLAFIVTILGLVYRGRRQADVDAPHPAIQAATPLVLASIVVALATRDYMRDDIDAVEAVLFSVLLALLILRQTVAFYQNERLRSGLAQANEKLAAAAAFRMQFINATAHELSNPLTPLRIHADLLKDPLYAADPANRQRSADVLIRNIERLIALVGDLLDLGRIESGKVLIQSQPTSVVRLAAETVELFETTARQRNLRLELASPQDVVANVDPQRLTQVLTNLVSNAIKYSPDGETVLIRIIPSSKSVEIQIRDRGPGLTPDQQAALFRPFAQVHDSAAQRPGTGLGLYICATLASHMGGRVGCSSEGPGHGSTFWLSIPIQAPVVAGGPEAAPHR